MKIYQKIALLNNARTMCEKRNNTEWFDNHTNRIEQIVKEYLPSGSGFDCGTIFNFEKSNGDKLVFNTSFHHMDENGYYSGWTEHEIIITPEFCFGFDIKVIGKNINDIKDYIEDQFIYSLNEEYKEEVKKEE